MLKHFVLHNKKYNTYPIVVHFPGRFPKTTNLWKNLNKITNIKTPKSSYIDTSIFTWNNKEKGILEKSLDCLGYKYNVLSTNEKWTNVLKIKLTYDYLKSIKTKYVMAFDSFDVLVLKDPKIILNKFLKFNCKLLFNSQSYSYPRKRENNTFFDFYIKETELGQSYNNKYLNSGVWVGETEFCKDFFHECLSANLSDDDPNDLHWRICEQTYIKTIACNKNLLGKEIKLDYKSDIFQILEQDQSHLEII